MLTSGSAVISGRLPKNVNKHQGMHGPSSTVRYDSCLILNGNPSPNIDYDLGVSLNSKPNHALNFDFALALDSIYDPDLTLNLDHSLHRLRAHSFTNCPVGGDPNKLRRCPFCGDLWWTVKSAHSQNTFEERVKCPILGYSRSALEV
ncbi:hypothetical protein EVAR_10658_1 [Eumeta japonica]|uniref:Uncharacterized protein n=1 Tax=Eumeta variegata TaxID=151549 RepID=A0A4C1U751_EUMVA|nr:hypothetical protein EVAR_10658_1 [Eumeta japonica]